MFGRGSTWCFDCDGTILESTPMFVAAHTQAAAALGGTPVHDYWSRRREGESEEALCAAAGVLEFARYQRLRAQVFDACASPPSAHPAAGPLIHRLRAIGTTVVVISHRSDLDSLLSDLRRADVLTCLSSVHATKVSPGAGAAPRGPTTAKADLLEGFAACGPTVMVGDSETDIAAARAAGVPSIGVASGCSSMTRLAAGGATWVVPSLRDLYETLFEHLQGEDECCSRHFAACAD